MDNKLYVLEADNLANMSSSKQEAVLALESGQVIYLPKYTFSTEILKSADLLTEEILDGKHKNISYDYLKKRLGGFNKQHENTELCSMLTTFMSGFAEFSKQLIETLVPQYDNHIRWGRTSYRPAEIMGRALSKRKDDTRLHVDAFPSTPVNGERILRVFCNINPHGQPRVWHLGEPYQNVMKEFSENIPDYNPLLAKLLYLVRATKSLRSAYDHYQLHLHDRMKLSEDYQNEVIKDLINFAPLSTWVVFTDQVSHAALSGQFLLEQTFYVSPKAMAYPDFAPLMQWEKFKGRRLQLGRA